MYINYFQCTKAFFSTNSTDIVPSFYCLVRYSTAAVTYSRTVFYTTGFINIVLFASLYDILSGNAKPFCHIHTNFLYFFTLSCLILPFRNAIILQMQKKQEDKQ